MKPIKYSLSFSNTKRKAYTFTYTYFNEIKKSYFRNLGTSAVQSDVIPAAFESHAFLDALQLFDKLSPSSVQSATTVISHFARQNNHQEAIYLFSRMLVRDCRPNEFTFGTVIHSATALKDLKIGKQLHACAMKLGLNSNVFVGSALIDFYAKLRSIEEAQIVFGETKMPNVVSFTTLINGYVKQERIEDALRIFRKMPERNVVSWNAMIGGFSQTGHNEKAVNLFIEMLRDGLLPTQSTFPCVICAAANISSLGIGRSFHACAIKFLGKKLDVFVSNSLVSFYAKCGNLEDSLLVFDKLWDRNIVSCNAVICGYAQNGLGEEAITFFEKMRFAGYKPNSVTLLGLLWACNHAGLVDKGYLYFNQAKLENPNMLKPEHYACMVDLLSRSGRFRQAKEFICNLPFDPGIGFWKALLGGCQIHSNTELGEFAGQKIAALDPVDVSSYVMLSNAHSIAGKWENVSTIRREMKERGLKRVPGCSWIEIRNKVHVFGNGDRNHKEKDEIYMALGVCIEQLREIEDSFFSGNFG